VSAGDLTRSEVPVGWKLQRRIRWRRGAEQGIRCARYLRFFLRYPSLGGCLLLLLGGFDWRRQIEGEMGGLNPHDSLENAVHHRGSAQPYLADHEYVVARALCDVSVLREQQRGVSAVALDFQLGEAAVLEMGNGIHPGRRGSVREAQLTAEQR
jgi:hypothetical protein